jgi:hypothetical protein
VTRTASCGPHDARLRLRQAESFLLVAELVLAQPDDSDLALTLKDGAQYGILPVGRQRAAASVAWAARLVAASRRVVGSG